MTSRQTRAAETWMTRALCVTKRPDLPWVTDADLVDEGDVETMRRVCRLCPVRVACTRHAVVTKATAGFWSGLHRDPLELIPIRRSA